MNRIFFSINNFYQYLALDELGRVSETSSNVSKSQNLTVLSQLEDASKNSCGWNSTSVIEALCFENSVITFPTRISHIYKTIQKHLRTQRIHKTRIL